MTEIMGYINQYGTSIVLLAYFLYKDFKFNQSIIDLLGEMKTIITELRTFIGGQSNDAHS